MENIIWRTEPEAKGTGTIEQNNGRGNKGRLKTAENEEKRSGDTGGRNQSDL